MVLQHLQQLDSFAHLRFSELNTVAQHTRLLCIPRARWLLRPGRRLSGAYFLRRGRMRLWQPERVLRSDERGARQPFYPGCSAALTLSQVQLLQVDLRPIAFLLDGLPVQLGGFELNEEPWLARFLDSPLLRQLDTHRWQRLLRSMSALRVGQGQPVFARGAVGDCFYLVKQGRLLVHRSRTVLAELSPGDVFGEDALILGARRNASVTALCAVELMCLPRRAFLELLVRGVVPFARSVESSASRAQLLNVGPAPVPGALALPLYDFRQHSRNLAKHCSYYVTGARLSACLLAAFLLLQRGYRAFVLLGDGPLPGNPGAAVEYRPETVRT